MTRRPGLGHWEREGVWEQELSPIPWAARSFVVPPGLNALFLGWLEPLDLKAGSPNFYEVYAAG